MSVTPTDVRTFDWKNLLVLPGGGRKRHEARCGEIWRSGCVGFVGKPWLFLEWEHRRRAAHGNVQE